MCQKKGLGPRPMKDPASFLVWHKLPCTMFKNIPSKFWGLLSFLGVLEGASELVWPGVSGVTLPRAAAITRLGRVAGSASRTARSQDHQPGIGCW